MGGTVPNWWSRLMAGRRDAQSRTTRRDELTGLTTRPALVAELRQARASGRTGCLLLMDIDRFKLVNDRHGHERGDTMLVAIARRLQACVPPGALLGRMGGDEFAVFLPGVVPAEAQAMLPAIMARVREPVALVDTHVSVTVSVGIAAFPGQSIDAVFQACDLAMYAAKARGRDRAVVFDQDTRRVVAARRELASAVAELQERNRVLHDEARTDALTGLRNARALDELMPTVLGGVDAAWGDAAVAFLDVDHFGDYNHRYGDRGGDEVLRRVAAAIRASARDADLAFRKGGEEMVVVLPGVNRETAERAAERLRAAVQALGIAHAGSGVAGVVTATVGVATGAAGCTLRQLLIAASQQAMAAKVAGGRNRVHATHLDPA
jgi:diguanylate cyclase (GGDEF)-like protein